MLIPIVRWYGKKLILRVNIFSICRFFDKNSIERALPFLISCWWRMEKAIPACTSRHTRSRTPSPFLPISRPTALCVIRIIGVARKAKRNVPLNQFVYRIEMFVFFSYFLLLNTTTGILLYCLNVLMRAFSLLVSPLS